MALSKGTFVLAAGMGKAGSSWLTNMVNEILVSAGFDDARQVRTDYGLEEELGPWYTPIIDKKSARDLEWVERALHDGKTFVAKTHRPPNTEFRRLVDAERMKAVYVYRDPRDVVVSAYDHGVRDRKAGKLPIRGFARFVTIPMVVRWVRRRLLPVWEQWQSFEGTLSVTYEDLVRDTAGVLATICRHLDLDVERPVLQGIADRFSPTEIGDETVRSALHIHKAAGTRYESILTPAQIEMCNREFAPYLERMGYQSRPG